MEKEIFETFEELDNTILENVKLHITTQEEVCKKANKINNGLSHKEQPRLTFFAYVWENFKKEFKLIFRF